MPHAQRYFSRECGSSLESSVKKSKYDYSELCKKDTEEFIPLDADSQETGSDKSKKQRFGKTLSGSKNEAKPRSSGNKSPYRKEESNKKQPIVELPKADKSKNSSEEKFSETSTAFIGPLCRPPPQVQSVSKTARKDDGRPLPKTTTTVKSGNSASKRKGEDGINCELLQFYKELDELEATGDDGNSGQISDNSIQPGSEPTIHQVIDHHSQTSHSLTVKPSPSKPLDTIPPSYHPNPILQPEFPAQPPINNWGSFAFPFPPPDHNISQTTADGAQWYNYYPGATPPVNLVQNYYSQTPYSHTYNPMPSIPSDLMPPSYYFNEAPVSQAEQPTLPPINNWDSWGRPLPFGSSSLVSQSVPPSGNHNITQPSSTFPGNAPTIPQVKDHYNQTAYSLPCNPSPSKPPEGISPDEEDDELPSTNWDPCEWSLSCDTSQSSPPPGVNIKRSTAESDQRIGSNPSNAPTIPQVKDYHSRTSYSQPCNSSPSNQPDLNPRSHNSNDTPISPADLRAPPPMNKWDSCDRPFSFEKSSSFVSQSLTPPGHHNIRQTSTNSDQRFSSYKGNAPTVPQVKDYHSQTSYSQSCNSSPSNLIPPRYHSDEASSLPDEFPALAPTSNRDSSDLPLDGTSPPPGDHNFSRPTFDSDQFSSYLDDEPTEHQVKDHDSPPSYSQPFNPLRSKPSDRFSPNDHLNEDPDLPAEHSALPPPIKTKDSHDGPFSSERASSFASRLLPPSSYQGPPPPSLRNYNPPPPRYPPLPPSGFQGFPPPPFVGNYDAPPPRYKSPLMVSREDRFKNSQYHENENYHRENDDYRQPTIQEQLESLDESPENQFSPQGREYTERFTWPPVESSLQGYHRELEKKGRNLNEIQLPQDPHEQYSSRFRDSDQCTDVKRKLVLLRGLPGSGKSTLARTLLDQSPDGIIYSTDDYFCQENGYTYDVKLLGDAHDWNQNRARRAMDDGMSPIIIDNTNIQSWEMKPYVQMAIERSYRVEFLEPNTRWRLDPNELEKRNTHRVPREKIAQMLERFEHNMDIGTVINSVEPRHVRGRPPPDPRPRWGGSVDCSPPSTSFQIT